MENAANPKSRRKRIQRGVFIYAIVPYLSVTAIFTLGQRQLMYRPAVADNLSVKFQQLDDDHISDVSLNAFDGETLNGWLLSASGSESPSRHLVIYFPGNSMNRLQRLADLREIASNGYDVLIFDYRGFGDSSGSPSESGITRDAKSIWQYTCNELKYSENQIVIFGESLGGAVALSLWSDDHPPGDIRELPNPKALILSSTFASMPRTVKYNYPWFPFQYLVLDRWPSIDRIRSVTCPITILHGVEDELVPICEARALAAASDKANFIEIPGAGHNGVPVQKLSLVLPQLTRPNASFRQTPQR